MALNKVGRKPLVVVVGATGTGKTKVAVELCLRFSGEVVNADSMQIYDGLQVATNRTSEEQTKGVRHHMFGFLSPLSIGFTVVNYRDRTLPILEDIWKKKKVPFLVGGTAYYLEGILWDGLLSDTRSSDNLDNLDARGLFRGLPKNYLSMSSDELYSELRLVDSISASKIHPHCRRQILRALQIYFQEGKKKSDLLVQQKQRQSFSNSGSSLRFPNTCILWLNCNSEVLDERLDARVEEMLCAGLREEICDFYDNYYKDYEAKLRDLVGKLGIEGDSGGSSVGNLKGLFQSIALKEFLPFLRLPVQERNTATGVGLFLQGVERLKIATRQYARRQKRWVANRLIRPVDRQVPPVYVLDTTNEDMWNADVLGRSFEVVDSFLSERKCPFDPIPADPNFQFDKRNQVYFCEECGIATQGLDQWEKHVRGGKHKNKVTYLKKREQYSILQHQLELRRLQLNQDPKFISEDSCIDINEDCLVNLFSGKEN